MGAIVTNTPAFLYDDLVRRSSTTIAATTEAMAFPKENVQHPFRTKRWNSKGIGSETMTFNVSGSPGNTQTASAVYIIEDNFTGSDWAYNNATIQANATDSWGAPTVSQVTNVRRVFTEAQAGAVDDNLRNTRTIAGCRNLGAQSLDFWRIIMPASVMGETINKIGRVMIGELFVPSGSFAVGSYSYALVDDGKQSISIGGQLHVDRQNSFAGFSMTFKNVTEGDVGQFLEMSRLSRNGRDIIMEVGTGDTDDQDRSFLYYGRVTVKSVINTLKTATDERYTVAISFRESI